MEASAGFDAAEVRALRDETPGCAERIHLNNCGAALVTRGVLDAAIEHLRLEARIGGYEAEEERRDEIERAYASVARLVGAERRQVAFSENATAAYAQALSSIPFERGDAIVTSSDDYVSNQIMLLSLARRLGVEVARVPDLPEGGIDVAALEVLVRERRPRLVALTHVPTNSGLVQPAAEVGRVCRETGVLYLLDACQSVGQLPVDVTELACDFLTTTCRKFLRGPRGIGFLVASDRVLESDLVPLFPDLQGAEWTAADAFRPAPTATRFENWEFPWALVLATGVAARQATALGIERSSRRIRDLAALLRGELAGHGLRVLDRGPELSGIVTVVVPGLEPEAFHARLLAQRVNASISRRAFAVIDFDRKGVDWALRMAPHVYNTEEEVIQAAATVAELAADGDGPG